MRFVIHAFRVLCLATTLAAASPSLAGVVLGRPVPGTIIVEPAPLLPPPPSPEVCLQRFQRRATDCAGMFPCGWYSPIECFDELDACVAVAQDKYDNCIDRAFPVLQ